MAGLLAAHIRVDWLILWVLLVTHRALNKYCVLLKATCWRISALCVGVLIVVE